MTRPQYGALTLITLRASSLLPSPRFPALSPRFHGARPRFPHVPPHFHRCRHSPPLHPAYPFHHELLPALFPPPPPRYPMRVPPPSPPPPPLFPHRCCRHFRPCGWRCSCPTGGGVGCCPESPRRGHAAQLLRSLGPLTLRTFPKPVWGGGWGGILILSKSLTTVAPPTFFHEIAGFKTRSRSYLLRYGVPRHPDVVDR